jgi:hypothetical protein
LANLSLFHRDRLIRINNALALIGPDSLPADAVEPAIAAALNSAAPLYRAQLWEQHRRANDQWIAAREPLVRRHAPALAKMLSAAYHEPWPTAPILVDLSVEAGPDGAYTTADAPSGFGGHTVIAPSQYSDPDMAFEIVFHEASHTMGGAFANRLSKEGRVPDLWHVLIFYTSGELVRRELGKQNDPNYKTIGDRVYPAAGWQKLHAAAVKDWQPYLDGKTSFDDAVKAVVHDATER